MLAELAAVTDSALAGARAMHAAALVAADAPELEAAADRFEVLGAWLAAAETVAAAADERRRRHERRSAAALDLRVDQLLARCEGARTPALISTGGRAAHRTRAGDRRPGRCRTPQQADRRAPLPLGAHCGQPPQPHLRQTRCVESRRPGDRPRTARAERAVTPDQLALVQSSYAALGADASAMAVDFYRRLFAADSSTRALFTDGPEIMALKFTAELEAIVEAITSFDEFRSPRGCARRPSRRLRSPDRALPRCRRCAHRRLRRPAAPCVGSGARGGMASRLQPGRRGDDGRTAGRPSPGQAGRFLRTLDARQERPRARPPTKRWEHRLLDAVHADETVGQRHRPPVAVEGHRP